MEARTSQGTARTYNPNVRVANWNEELCMEEDILKDFLDKQEAGNLLIQRSQTLMQTCLAKTECCPNDVKEVKFNSNFMMVNPGREGMVPTGDKQMENLPRKLLAGRNCSSISLNVDAWPAGGLETLVQSNIGLTGAVNTETSCVRNTFTVVKIDTNAAGNDDTLRYGDKFALKSVLQDGQANIDLFITADRIRLGGSSQSRTGVSHIECVPVDKNVKTAPFCAQWVVESFDPLLRMEHEGLPVRRNEPVTIKHCATGQHLAVIEKTTTRTPFGRELELGVQTYFNSHKAEMDNNYWIFV